MKQILGILAVVILAAASGCATTQATPAKSDGVMASAKGASTLQCTAGWHACTCSKEEKCCSFQKECECTSGGQATCH